MPSALQLLFGRRFFATAVSLAAVLAPAMIALATAQTLNGKEKIIFVCQFGSVKSQIAAAHFNRIAKERGLPYVAISRGLTPDTSIPTKLRGQLADDGLAPLDDVPLALTSEEAKKGAKVIAFDEVPSGLSDGAAVTYWRNVPAVSADYGASRDAMIRNMEAVFAELRSKR